MTETLRPDLTPLPARLKKLPIRRGYPVPWFVAKVNGEYDFRVPEVGRREEAVKKHKCWICGEILGVHMAFVIGPMCAVNRVSSDPAMHRECALWSLLNCPFLTKPQMVRREKDLPEGSYQQDGFIGRNPGVTLLWMTKHYKTFNTADGWLIRIGMPRDWKDYRERREATQEELIEAIRSGLPLLVEQTDGAQGSLHQLRMHVYEAETLLRLPKNLLASMIPNAKAVPQSSTLRIDG